MTFLELKNLLSDRLGDAGFVFWAEAEVEDLLREALRTWQALTGWHTTDTTLTTVSGQSAYALEQLAPLVYPNESEIIASVNFALMEPTAQFDSGTISDAAARRRDEMVFKTQSRLAERQYSYGANAPSIALSPTTLDVYRVAIADRPLWPSDEWQVKAFGLEAAAPGTPETYNLRHKTLRLYPRPSTNSTVVTIESRAGTAQAIPANFLPFLKWAVLADVLSTDGQGYDALRAAYCQQRYEEGVRLLLAAPLILAASIGGTPLALDAITELDGFQPAWKTGANAPPTQVAIAGYNLVFLNQVRNTSDDIVLTVFAAAPLPSDDGDEVTLWPEHLAAVLDIAHHTALFKSGGEEWAASAAFYQRALAVAREVADQRLAAALYEAPLAAQSRKQEEAAPPRRENE